MIEVFFPPNYDFPLDGVPGVMTLNYAWFFWDQDCKLRAKVDVMHPKPEWGVAVFHKREKIST